MWQSNYIQSNDIRLHYTRDSANASANAGKPVLILLHGFSDDGLCWLPVAEVLKADCDIIMVDARGHGRSDGPFTGYTHDHHAADVAGLIAGLGLRKPFVMGHSMGAVTTLALASTYPDLPGAIALEDPPPFWMPTEVTHHQTERRSNMGGWIIELKRKTAEEMLAENRKGSPTWPEAEREPWVNSKLRMSFNVLNAFTERGTDLRTFVSKIACPGLLLTADTTMGAITSAAQAQELQRLVPQMQHTHIPQAGHSIRRDQSVPYLQAVQTFLRAQAK